MKNKLTFLILSLTLITGIFILSSCGNNNKSVPEKDSLGTTNPGILVIGLDDKFPPMGYRDKEQNLVGFDIDLAKAVGKEINLKVDFKPISWDAKDLELKSGNIDCIWNGMSVTPEREKAMALSNKYLNNKIVLMKLNNKKIDITKAEDLSKYNIGTQSDSSALEVLKANKEYEKFKKNIREYKDYDNALLDLKTGRLDVVAIDEVVGSFKNKNMNNSLSTCSYNLGNDFYAIGFRKENTELRDKVNEAIKKLIDNGSAKKISEKWFGKDIVIFETL